MNKPNFYYSDDYAGLTFKAGGFYYGYERSKCTECGSMNNPGNEHCDKCEDSDSEWCFEANFDGEIIIIPFSKLGFKDMSDVVGCLNMGIGWILAKYKLTLPVSTNQD